jgi:hypothetical protein
MQRRTNGGLDPCGARARDGLGARVRRGLDNGERIWQAIGAAFIDAPVSGMRDRAPHGVVCGVVVMLTINDRTAPVATRGTIRTRTPRRGCVEFDARDGCGWAVGGGPRPGPCG